MNERLLKYYVLVWRVALRNLTNWSDEQIQKWCDEWETIAADPTDNDLFYHETPFHYIVPMLIPLHLRDRLRGLERVGLEGRLQTTIEEFAKPSLEQEIEKAPWDEIKNAIDRIIRHAEQTSRGG